MAQFYGLEIADSLRGTAVVRSTQWQATTQKWLTPGNHNFLRITRIVHSLSLLGQRDLAVAFLVTLEEIYSGHRDAIGSVSIRHWRAAVEP